MRDTRRRGRYYSLLREALISSAFSIRFPVTGDVTNDTDRVTIKKRTLSNEINDRNDGATTIVSSKNDVPIKDPFMDL